MDALMRQFAVCSTCVLVYFMHAPLSSPVTSYEVNPYNTYVYIMRDEMMASKTIFICVFDP